MNDESTIIRLRLLFGVGGITSRAHNNPNAARAYIWSVTARDAGKVLVAVLPFLFTKKAEAALVMEFLSLPVTEHGTFAKKVNPKILANRERLYWKLRKLKPSWKTRYKNA